MEPLQVLLDLLNLLALTLVVCPCGYLLSNGVSVNLSLSQVCIKLPSISHDFNLISFELLNKNQGPKSLRVYFNLSYYQKL